VNMQGVQARPEMSQQERNLWANAPVLTTSGAGYRGHVFAEVWADGFVCVAMSDPRLAGHALAALHGPAQVSETVRSIPASPVMTEREAPFLGRAIIEFFTDQAPVVGAIGAEPGRLLELTRAQLKSID